MTKTNNTRRYPNGFGKRPDKTEIKQDQAQERQEYYDGLTIERKIQKLDQKLGEGIGAKKQRSQFAALLNKPEATTDIASETKEDEQPTKLKAKERRKNEQK